MNVHLEAGGLVLPKTKVDAASTEQIVARSYKHPALGARPVIRLASDRLGQAEDLAMEFLGFEAPAVSAPIAQQQRRSLSFAAWALINDPKNARYALDLVKRMKRSARQARSKPGHAWDAYAEMAKDLGRSARHFLPPFWEEVGRTFKDLGNQTYAGRALNKSLEAERVHALESDKARRRDVVLEFVLSGCLAGSALSEYGNDLLNQYDAPEAYAIFRDLSVRRTRGGMSPWATMPKDFAKLAKAAKLDADQELEKWLEEVIDAPAMGRAPLQFWKVCSPHCQRIVARSPAFAVALLRHTRPETRYYGDSKTGAWFELLNEWGVMPYLYEDGLNGAPPLGEPIALWFSRIIQDEVPAPTRTLAMLEKLLPRLRKENVPVPLSVKQRWYATQIDIDVLEALLANGVKVDDPPPDAAVAFEGWLTANADHQFRNQDIAASWKDERFRAKIFAAMDSALQCKGGTQQRGYRQASLEQRPFPLAAGDRPGIKELWHAHTSGIVAALDDCGLASFEMARARLESTLWPDTLRLFPDIAERLGRIDPVAMLRRTLQAGVIDEYGMPALEQAVEQAGIKIEFRHHDSNFHLAFPSVVITDRVHATVIRSDSTIKKHELRLPKKAQVSLMLAVGDDLLVSYRDDRYMAHLYWVSDPGVKHDAGYGYHGGSPWIATPLKDGSVFFGQESVRTGDKKMPSPVPYLHDGERFWRLSMEYDAENNDSKWKIREVDPQTGKVIRDSVPAFFEDAEGGDMRWNSVELLKMPAGAEDSPLGVKDGLIGWKTFRRRDGGFIGVGIDGRRWDKPLVNADGSPTIPVALLRQPGASNYLPVTADGRINNYWLWDPTGTTIIANLHDFGHDYAHGQVALLPLHFWHLFKVRDEESSRKLRAITHEQCESLLKAAGEDRPAHKGPRRAGADAQEIPLTKLLPAVNSLLPTAPERLSLGVARVIERAERESAAFTAMRTKSSSDASKGASSESLALYSKSDSAAAQWGMHYFHIYSDEGNTSVSANMAAAVAFFKGEADAGELPRTNYLWFSMLESSALRCWQTFWRATAAKMTQKGGGDVPWLEFLKLWHQLGIPELPGQFDTMEGHPEGAKKRSWRGYEVETEAGVSFALQNGDDRFIAVENDNYDEPYSFLRYSTAQTPGPPPGYQVKNVRKLKVKYDPAQIAAFITASEAATALPVPTPDELAAVAKNLSASPAEIALIWMGGLHLDKYENNFLPADVRSAFGMKTTDASAGRQALRNLNLTVVGHLYEAVVAPGCAAPFAAERGPVLRSIEKVWQAKMPKRLQLDAALQKRLSALGRMSRWHQLDHEELLAVAADPAEHPLLQPREIEIKMVKPHGYASLNLAGKSKNDEAISDDALRSILQLVGLIHAESAAGHPARADMPALIKQTTKLLDHASTLLPLRSVYLYSEGRKVQPTPTEWLSKHVGKAKANAKDGTLRCDDGLLSAAALDAQRQVFVAFRPAKLKRDGDLARLLAILGIAISGDEDDEPSGAVPVIAAIKSPGFQKLAKAIVAAGVPEGQWPQNPLHTAPGVVKAVQKKLKLGEDAAVVYLQLLALPDPTAANICAWNGWSASQLNKASAELVKHKLVLEASRTRAGRSIFLPGEWSDLKSPWLPIETWKLAHLCEFDLNARQPCPAGGPMVLRPFDELFAAAWKRVVDGDEPRYEDVKRKKKK